MRKKSKIIIILTILVTSSIYLVLITGCNRQQSANPVIGTVLSEDGIPISYQVRGIGKPALVFVHGWCCDKSYWDSQVKFFARNYTVVTVDLPGHGDSGMGRKEWTIPAYGKDIAVVEKKLGLNQVILVGHSIGGSVILEAARRMPDTIIGIIGVDTFHNVELKYTPEFTDTYLAPFYDDFAEATANMVRNMFIPSTDSVLVEKIVIDMSSAPPEVGIGELIGNGNYHNDELLQTFREAQVPIRCINSDKVPTDVETIRKYALSFEVKYMPDVGHFVMMEDPETFNRLLEETVQKLIDLNAAK
ncbi:MAG: alpha/beta hydrolase [Candidatus Latescibacteria bacterium]|nr:alpha/beta hydrolase [Candidatus Latescibacterota bacterium]